jgi:hypothetical protein
MPTETKEKRQRHKLDAYYTAEKLTQALVHNVLAQYITPNTTFLEPCNGLGAISSVIDDYVFSTYPYCEFGDIVECWDIDPELMDGHNDKICDSSLEESWYGVMVDWVVSNPPYTQPECQQIIEHSFNHVRCGIAMLLRLSYDEPCAGRAEFLQNTLMSHQIIFNPRPQFRTDTKGTDNVTSCWFVWLKEDFAKECGIAQTEKIYVTDWRS